MRPYYLQQRYGPTFSPARLIIVLALFCLAVAYMDKDGDNLDAEQYCANVHDKTWPDYRGIFKEMCTKSGKVKRL